MTKTEQSIQQAEEIIRSGAVIISAADFEGKTLQRIQVYFWDEHEAAMDIIDKSDLLENWPDDGVYVLTLNGANHLTPVSVYEVDEKYFLRLDDQEIEADDLGNLPNVIYMETIEAICGLKDPIKL